MRSKAPVLPQVDALVEALDVEGVPEVIERHHGEASGDDAVDVAHDARLGLLVWQDEGSNVPPHNLGRLVPEGTGDESEIVSRVETVPDGRHCEGGKGCDRGWHPLVHTSPQPV